MTNPPRKATSPFPLWKIMTNDGAIVTEIHARDADTAIEQAEDMGYGPIEDVMDDILVIVE